jgi:meiotically up-regulated gene 157 (Mug157) protein
MSEDIRKDIYKRGITKDSEGNDIFAYEIDGFGNYLKMDDAGLPSLLSLPYIGFILANSSIYTNTRKFIFNPLQNPYFYIGN